MLSLNGRGVFTVRGSELRYDGCGYGWRLQMERTLLLTATLLASGLFALHAQQASNDANPLYRPTSIRLSTISVPPLAGIPFSATALIENRQTMPDGTIAVSRNVNVIARDSRGRTHGEMRPRLPADSPDTPPLIEVVIYDPQTRTRIDCDMAAHVATRRSQHEQRETGRLTPSSSPLVKVEDLGSNTLDGVDVKGTRRTVTIPGNANGTGAPITVVDEYWYSQDLHLNILLLHNDPRTGQQTIALSNLKREEPDAALFEVPTDFKVVDITPPAGVHSASSGGSPASTAKR